MATGAVTEQVAEHLEEAAVVARHIDQRVVSYFVGGIGVGLVCGFFLGYRWNRKRLRADILAEAELEIAEVREHYRQKTLAAEPKPNVETIVREKGYQEPPRKDDIVATTHPEPETRRPLRPVVPVREPTDAPKNNGWDQDAELARRGNKSVYIIHQNEFERNELGWTQHTFTFYADDEVLTDHTDTPVGDRDEIAGDENLMRFGYGADDPDTVYVRNEHRHIELEICQMHQSYEETILGLSNDHDDAS